jgi:quercetin dioxygenase-like cupin family protein
MIFEIQAKHQEATEELREWALLYSLGLLEPEMASGFKQHLETGCAVCLSELREFRETTAQMIYSVPDVAPHPRVREKLLSKVTSAQGKRSILRSEEGEWKPTPFAGVTSKLLFFDRESGMTTSLVRMTAGSVFPSHNHAGPEHSYVLEGDVQFEDHILWPGDYEVALPSSAHTSITTTQGCLLLIVNHISNLRLLEGHTH